ncbi:MAG: hypothetical protein EWV71_22640 [Microcystis flos-aquae Mf_QC_C_20070823_S20D]|nr:MAG: hypothetical protein EWV71_22640 [Microcystis flos-aquae Mf_QC_C_20070823_S20D]
MLITISMPDFFENVAYKDNLIFEEMLEFCGELGYDIHAVVLGFTDAKTVKMLQLDGIFFKS